VVDDQSGAPTWCRDIAQATARIVAAPRDASGVYHLSAGGATTWWGFARAIVAEAGIAVEVLPIASAEYPAAVVRPRYSVLDGRKLAREFGIALPDWRESLGRCMAGHR
jgi:dTDP-4-dehydrorhamnose reductase